MPLLWIQIVGIPIINKNSVFSSLHCFLRYTLVLKIKYYFANTIDLNNCMMCAIILPIWRFREKFWWRYLAEADSKSAIVSVACVRLSWNDHDERETRKALSTSEIFTAGPNSRSWSHISKSITYEPWKLVVLIYESLRMVTATGSPIGFRPDLITFRISFFESEILEPWRLNSLLGLTRRPLGKIMSLLE